ncbi:hypothetical protein BDF14DRAFT_1852963 [Spinellus fusiger]|nr:hypothetical protein BDF14DRAFT_1852963 [Spinellus fusiger]
MFIFGKTNKNNSLIISLNREASASLSSLLFLLTHADQCVGLLWYHWKIFTGVIKQWSTIRTKALSISMRCLCRITIFLVPFKT